MRTRTDGRPRPPRGPSLPPGPRPRRTAPGPTAPLARRLVPALAALPALAGCSVRVDGAEVSALWWAAAALLLVLLLAGTALGARRSGARRPARELARARRDREALAADAEARLSTVTAERQGLLHERERLAAQLTELTGQRDELLHRQHESAAEQQQLTLRYEELAQERDEANRERDELQGSVDATFVNLAMRTLTLVERQLVLIEGLEGREADSAQLESLFRLDHLATRMRRNSENMLLLAGLENSQRSRTAVSLLDVVRAAVSEIERYERVRIGFLASVRLSGAVADDTSHLLAELLENATAFSPPQDQVEVGGWLLDNGEVMLSVTDRGIGLPTERMRRLNEQLSEPPTPAGPGRRDALLAGALSGRSMGLFVVARLAGRHGMRVQLRDNAQGGGVTAMVVMPRGALLEDTVTTADLDDQRRAERNAATAAVEQARSAAGAAGSA
ncbi:ATP-binding protein, partial [Kitasatospora sp. NPDC004240]